MMADSETMSYNHAWGGIIPFPKEKWHDWYDFWFVNHESNRYYYSRFLKGLRVVPDATEEDVAIAAIAASKARFEFGETP